MSFKDDQLFELEQAINGTAFRCHIDSQHWMRPGDECGFVPSAIGPVFIREDRSIRLPRPNPEQPPREPTPQIR